MGKTHILSRYIRNALPKNKYPTIGVEFATKAVPLRAGGTVKAQIWDTAGQESFKPITKIFYRGAHLVILTYDITRMDTFLNLETWFEEIRSQSEPDVLIILVGNCKDKAEL